MKSTAEKWENVLLLAMSTFPKSDNENLYKYTMADGEEVFVNGISQLEAGTKSILRILEKRGEKPDRIVVMNTNATEAKYAGKEERCFKGYSPYEFYVSRILAYDETLSKDVFIPINIEEKGDRYFLDVSEAIKGRANSQINLYMDMQGGDRNMVFSMNAVAELLKNQGVTVCERLATRYDKDNEVNEVCEVSERYRTYELLTAMEVFIKYGWGNELEQFFKYYANGFDKDIVSAIKTASTSIQTCDVGGFDSAVSRLGELIKAYRMQEENAKHSPYMDIIIDEISKDYGELLQENVKLRYVGQIRWCIRKGFLQQAISILESKMPHEYVVSGVKYYCQRGTDEAEVTLKMFRRIYTFIKEKREKELYKLADINQFYIRYFRGIVKYNQDVLSGIDCDLKYSDYVEQNIDGSDVKSQESLEKELKTNIDLYFKLCAYRNKIAHVVSQVDVNKKNSFYNEVYKTQEAIIPAEKLVDRMNEFLDEFCRMADAITEIKSIDLE